MKAIVLFFLFLSMGSVQAYSNSISITPSQVLLSNSQLSSVSVVTQNLQPVYSMLITLSYDSSVMGINNIVLGSDAKTCQLLNNSSSGQTTIAIYCTSPIAAGNAQVATLGLTAQNIAQDLNASSDLTITVQYDEIKPPLVQSYAGFFNIVNGFTFAVNSEGNGSVSVSPTQAIYSPGSQVTLTATAANGYQFSAWGGDVTATSNPVTVTVNANMNITASFSAVQTSPAPKRPTAGSLSASVESTGIGNISSSVQTNSEDNTDLFATSGESSSSQGYISSNESD